MWRRLNAAVCCLVLFTAVALCSDTDRKTTVTLHEPVIVAGVPVVTLEPGTYVIQVMNNYPNRNFVQFLNERGDHLYTTAHAIPKFRMFPKDKTVLTFWETPRGYPLALRAWFAAGDDWGREFPYPKGLAPKIAREAGEPAPSIVAETVETLTTEPVAQITKRPRQRLS